MAVTTQDSAEQRRKYNEYNMYARSRCVSEGVNWTQQIYTNTFTNYVAGQQYVLNIKPSNTGLLKRFYVEITGRLSQSAAETHTLTPYGGSNILSQVVLTDQNSNQRIQTTGWHLHLLGSARRQYAYGTAFTGTDQVLGPRWVGSGVSATNPLFQTMPTPLTTDQNFRWFYEIPVCYSDTDLSGTIWCQTLNSSMNLQLVINPNFFVTSTADPVQAVYQSSTTALGNIETMTVTVYQNSLDQLPRDGKGAYILPPLDLQNGYMLYNTNFTSLLAGSTTQLPYANWRSFLSTFVIFDNAGTLNFGTDLNFIGLQSANFINVFQIDPFLSTLFTRLKLNDDIPAGSYYIDTRSQPINTLQYGNMQLSFQPSTVAGATAQLLVGYECLALLGAIPQAGSIAQGS